jgi:energy-converting hydrogenase Eha subunit G
METIEILVYGVFSGLVGGVLASAVTFYLIERNAKIIQRKLAKEVKVMSEQMKLSGLDQINSNIANGNKEWN